MRVSFHYVCPGFCKRDYSPFSSPLCGRPATRPQALDRNKSSSIFGKSHTTRTLNREQTDFVIEEQWLLCSGVKTRCPVGLSTNCETRSSTCGPHLHKTFGRFLSKDEESVRESNGRENAQH